MLNFNLIPKEIKEEIKKENFWKVTVGILKGLILSLLIVFTMILNGYLILSFLSGSQKVVISEFKNSSNAQKLIALEKEVKEKNAILDSILSVQSNIFYFAPPIEEISELLPKGTYLKSLTIERKVEGQTQQTSENQSSAEGSTSIPSPTPSSQNQPQSKKEYIEVTIEGIAKTREDVILLEKKLRSREQKVKDKDYVFKNISSAPVNILKPTNTDFSFTFRLEKIN